MTSAPAWADYLDARLRLVREWTDDGLSPIAIALRLTPTAVEVLRLTDTPTEPPIPGCSRDLLATWRDRAARLEAELHDHGGRSVTMPPPDPPISMIRALALDPDPAICGCQYWHDRPRPGEHHAGCVHFPKPESGS